MGSIGVAVSVGLTLNMDMDVVPILLPIVRLSVSSCASQSTMMVNTVSSGVAGSRATRRVSCGLEAGTGLSNEGELGAEFIRGDMSNAGDEGDPVDPETFFLRENRPMMGYGQRLPGWSSDQAQRGVQVEVDRGRCASRMIRVITTSRSTVRKINPRLVC